MGNDASILLSRTIARKHDFDIDVQNSHGFLASNILRISMEESIQR
jgi:hypothetical protein